MCVGLFSCVWVSFHVCGSLFICVGLFSCVWVSFVGALSSLVVPVTIRNNHKYHDFCVHEYALLALQNTFYGYWLLWCSLFVCIGLFYRCTFVPRGASKDTRKEDTLWFVHTLICRSSTVEYTYEKRPTHMKRDPHTWKETYTHEKRHMTETYIEYCRIPYVDMGFCDTSRFVCIGLFYRCIGLFNTCVPLFCRCPFIPGGASDDTHWLYSQCHWVLFNWVSSWLWRNIMWRCNL